MNKKSSTKSRSTRASKLRSRWSNLAIYGGGLIVLTVIIATGYSSPSSSGQDGIEAPISNISSAAIIAASEINTISHANTVADNVSLAIAGSVSEHADSASILAMIDQSTATIVNNPSAATTNSGGPMVAAIVSHTVVEGDDAASIGARFGISEQTVRWANNLITNEVQVGAELTIPIIDGVVHTVRDNDDLDRIAERYQADQDQIIAINNLDGEDITPGMKLVLPFGVLPENERPGWTPPVVVNRPPVNVNIPTGGNARFGGSCLGPAPRPPDYNARGGWGFAFGNCTRYAFNRRIQMGRRMDGIRGHASQWAASAQAAGYLVNNTPAVGAILQTSFGWGGFGHVAIVEVVNADGSIIISEMNHHGCGGFNIVNFRSIYNPRNYLFIH